MIVNISTGSKIHHAPRALVQGTTHFSVPVCRLSMQPARSRRESGIFWRFQEASLLQRCQDRSPLGELLVTSWKLVASLVVFYIPLVQQIANLHVVIDLSGYQLVGNPKSCELVAN